MTTTTTPRAKRKTTPAAATETSSNKLQTLIALLKRPQGARLEEMTSATGWQAHSVRGALSGALKKQRQLVITSEKTESGRVYRIEDGAGA
jgi:hypothetical protein